MSFKDLIHFQTDREGTADGLNPPSAKSTFITHTHSKENPEKNAARKSSSPKSTLKILQMSLDHLWGIWGMIEQRVCKV